MNWIQLGQSITIASQRKWTEATTKTWFKFDFSPATEGLLEVTQGDGNLTIGETITIPTDRSPVILSLPMPLLINPQSRKLALKSSQKLKISVFFLDAEPIAINPDLSAIAQTIQAQQSQILALSNQLTDLLAMPLFSTSNTGSPTNCTATIVASATVVTTLFESNFNRKGGTIANNSTEVLYIDFGDTVTTTNYGVAIPPMAYYEVPFGIQTKIVGIWSAVNGSAFVRELT